MDGCGKRKYAQEARASARIPENGTDRILHRPKALAELAANWPASRLIDVFNSLPGVTPVKKFTDRKKAVARIWKAIQSLPETERQSAHVAPGSAKKSGTGVAGGT